MNRAEICILTYHAIKKEKGSDIRRSMHTTESFIKTPSSKYIFFIINPALSCVP